jgi:hypothetical protein
MQADQSAHFQCFEDRSTILINGRETVELDYGGFFPRALYHQTGQELAGEDPYDIPEVRHLLKAHGMDWSTEGRRAVKTMVNIAISAKRRTAHISEKSQKEISLPADTIDLCIPLLIAHHSPIKGQFFKGSSLTLIERRVRYLPSNHMWWNG